MDEKQEKRILEDDEQDMSSSISNSMRNALSLRGRKGRRKERAEWNEEAGIEDKVSKAIPRQVFIPTHAAYSSSSFSVVVAPTSLSYDREKTAAVMLSSPSLTISSVGKNRMSNGGLDFGKGGIQDFMTRMNQDTLKSRWGGGGKKDKSFFLRKYLLLLLRRARRNVLKAELSRHESRRAILRLLEERRRLRIFALRRRADWILLRLQNGKLWWRRRQWEKQIRRVIARDKMVYGKKKDIGPLRDKEDKRYESCLSKCGIPCFWGVSSTISMNRNTLREADSVVSAGFSFGPTDVFGSTDSSRERTEADDKHQLKLELPRLLRNFRFILGGEKLKLLRSELLRYETRKRALHLLEDARLLRIQILRLDAALLLEEGRMRGRERIPESDTTADLPLASTTSYAKTAANTAAGEQEVKEGENIIRSEKEGTELSRRKCEKEDGEVNDCIRDNKDGKGEDELFPAMTQGTIEKAEAIYDVCGVSASTMTATKKTIAARENATSKTEAELGRAHVKKGEEKDQKPWEMEHRRITDLSADHHEDKDEGGCGNEHYKSMEDDHDEKSRQDLSPKIVPRTSAKATVGSENAESVAVEVPSSSSDVTSISHGLSIALSQLLLSDTRPSSDVIICGDSLAGMDCNGSLPLVDGDDAGVNVPFASKPEPATAEADRNHNAVDTAETIAVSTCNDAEADADFFGNEEDNGWYFKRRQKHANGSDAKIVLSSLSHHKERKCPSQDSRFTHVERKEEVGSSEFHSRNNPSNVEARSTTYSWTGGSLLEFLHSPRSDDDNPDTDAYEDENASDDDEGCPTATGDAAFSVVAQAYANKKDKEKTDDSNEDKPSSAGSANDASSCGRTEGEAMIPTKARERKACDESLKTCSLLSVAVGNVTASGRCGVAGVVAAVSNDSCGDDVAVITNSKKQDFVNTTTATRPNDGCSLSLSHVEVGKSDQCDGDNKKENDTNGHLHTSLSGTDILTEKKGKCDTVTISAEVKINRYNCCLRPMTGQNNAEVEEASDGKFLCPSSLVYSEEVKDVNYSGIFDRIDHSEGPNGRSALLSPKEERQNEDGENDNCNSDGAGITSSDERRGNGDGHVDSGEQRHLFVTIRRPSDRCMATATGDVKRTNVRNNDCHENKENDTFDYDGFNDKGNGESNSDANSRDNDVDRDNGGQSFLLNDNNKHDTTISDVRGAPVNECSHRDKVTESYDEDYLSTSNVPIKRDKIVEQEESGNSLLTKKTRWNGSDGCCRTTKEEEENVEDSSFISPRYDNGSDVSSTLDIAFVDDGNSIKQLVGLPCPNGHQDVRMSAICTEDEEDSVKDGRTATQKDVVVERILDGDFSFEQELITSVEAESSIQSKSRCPSLVSSSVAPGEDYHRSILDSLAPDYPEGGSCANEEIHTEESFGYCNGSRDVLKKNDISLTFQDESEKGMAQKKNEETELDAAVEQFDITENPVEDENERDGDGNQSIGGAVVMSIINSERIKETTNRRKHRLGDTTSPRMTRSRAKKKRISSSVVRIGSLNASVHNEYGEIVEKSKMAALSASSLHEEMLSSIGNHRHAESEQAIRRNESVSCENKKNVRLLTAITANDQASDDGNLLTVMHDSTSSTHRMANPTMDHAPRGITHISVNTKNSSGHVKEASSSPRMTRSLSKKRKSSWCCTDTSLSDLRSALHYQGAPVNSDTPSLEKKGGRKGVGDHNDKAMTTCSKEESYKSYDLRNDGKQLTRNDHTCKDKKRMYGIVCRDGGVTTRRGTTFKREQKRKSKMLSNEGSAFRRGDEENKRNGYNDSVSSWISTGGNSSGCSSGTDLKETSLSSSFSLSNSSDGRNKKRRKYIKNAEQACLFSSFQVPKLKMKKQMMRRRRGCRRPL